MKTDVIIFPGSNCEHDVVFSLKKDFNAEVNLVWYKERVLNKPDLIVIPGGFSYGDYLRTGAMAKLAPIMTEVKNFAQSGGRVLGICNGFQILCETGLLPGVLLKNRSRKFISKFLNIKKEKSISRFSNSMEEGKVNNWPVAHFEGNYFARPETISELENNNQVAFRYATVAGEVSEESETANPNGSIKSIAGICNKDGNVLGLMPHPERIEKGLSEIL